MEQWNNGTIKIWKNGKMKKIEKWNNGTMEQGYKESME